MFRLLFLPVGGLLYFTKHVTRERAGKTYAFQTIGGICISNLTHLFEGRSRAAAQSTTTCSNWPPCHEADKTLGPSGRSEAKIHLLQTMSLLLRELCMAYTAPYPPRRR